MNYVELSEQELEESMGYGGERAGEHHFATNGSAPRAKSSKYHIKHKVTGKIISTHTSAPEAVRVRAKLKGGADSHSIIKEETMSATRELIDAIATGKSEAIDAAFNEVFATKVSDALDNFKNDVAANLFTTQESTVEEAKNEAWPANKAKKKPMTPADYAKWTADRKAEKKKIKEDVEEAVVPGSVKKDKDGNVVSAKTVPDKKAWSKENILGKSAAQHWADTGKASHPAKKD